MKFLRTVALLVLLAPTSLLVLLAPTSLLVLLAPTSVHAAGAEFVPLKDYLARPDVTKDPAALGYVMHRCSALYAVMAKRFEGETDPERQKLKDGLTGAAAKFLGAAVQLMMRGTTMDAKAAQARATSVIVDLANLYIDRMAAIELRTNNMFDDPLLTSDYATCGAVLKGMH